MTRGSKLMLSFLKNQKITKGISSLILMIFLMSFINLNPSFAAEENEGENLIPKGDTYTDILTLQKSNMKLAKEEIIKGLPFINSNDLTRDAFISFNLKDSRYSEVFLELTKRLHYEIQIEPKELSEKRFIFVFNLSLSLLSLSIEDGKPITPENFMNLLLMEAPENALNPKNQKIADHLEAVYIEFINKHKYIPMNNAVLNILILARNLVLTQNEAYPSVVEEANKDLKVPEVPYKLVSATPDFEKPDLKTLKSTFDQSSYLNSSSFSQDTQNIQRIREYLEKTVIEQPEVVDYLVSVERSKALRLTSEPFVYATIGLPGNGKDTIAESYVQAMHPTEKEEAVDKYLYRFTIAKDKSDLWSELGSSTGFVGSDEEAKFIAWAVSRSGGKYLQQEVRTMSGPSFKYVKNPLWKGVPLPGTTPPDKALVFINEFHNWSYQVKDEFLKQFIEKGVINVNNANGGEKTLEIPLTVQIASNNGIEAIADRYMDGRPRGKSQTFTELFSRWKTVYKNKRLLKSLLMKGSNNGGGSGAVGVSSAGGSSNTGTSEEVTNRIQNIFMLRPLSPEGVQRISQIALQKLAQSYLKIKPSIGPIELTWSENVPLFIQQYQYSAEDNARPIKNKITELIQATIDEVIFEQKIKTSIEGQKIHIDVTENKDGTFSMTLDAENTQNEKQTITVPIEGTGVTKYNAPLTNEEVDKLSNLRAEIEKHVVGLDQILDKVVDAIIATELDRNINLDRVGEKPRPAPVFGFFGLSSTGKTELGKVIAEVLTGARENVWEVEANHLQTEHKWEEFFGTESEDPNHRSKFQKEYDRRNGKMVVILDELTNVKDKSLLQKLYPYLRETEVAGRKMSNITFIITGNSGQEVLRGIPEGVPEQERFEAEQQIFKKFINNERLQEQILNRDFPEPLVKRIGLERAFFFPPLSHKAIRELFQIKIIQALDVTFSPHQERPWWNVKFKDTENFKILLDKLADEGFRQSGQGDSINRYANFHFGKNIKSLLDTNHVKHGVEVIVSLDEKQTLKYSDQRPDEDGKNKKGIYLKLEIPSESKTLGLFLPGKPYDRPLKPLDVERVKTAYHEAGHEIVGKALTGDLTESTLISIRPGVAEIDGKYIYYGGVRGHEKLVNAQTTREMALSIMAGLLGGEVAETLVTKNGRHTDGKHNDTERATHIARKSILMLGLSEVFGREAKSPDETIEQMEARILVSPKAEMYQQELTLMLKESRQMAVEAILINWDIFRKLGLTVAENLELKEDAIKEFYKNQKPKFLNHDEDKYIQKQVHIRNNDYFRSSTGKVTFLDTFVNRLSHKIKEMAQTLFGNVKVSSKITAADIKSRKVELLSHHLMPKKLADVDKIIAQEINDIRRSVPILEGIPFAETKKLSTPAKEKKYSDVVGVKTRLCAELFK